MDYTEIAPEWQQPNTVVCTSLQTQEGMYTISTCDLTRVPPRQAIRVRAITALGDLIMGHPEDRHKHFETLLFVNGKPAMPPFGDLPGNELQGVYQRYSTEEEALAGHRTFTEQVQRVLSERPAREKKTVYATVYRNGTNWEARILEPGKAPYFWAPPGTTLVRKIGLEAGIKDSYHVVRFVDKLSFALLVSGVLKG